MNDQLFSTDPPPKRARQREKKPVFEYVRDTWFEGKVAKCTSARIGRLARNFTELCGDVTPEEAVTEIKRRREVYKRLMPMMADTGEALFKNWSSMAARVKKLEANQSAQLRADLRRAEERLQDFKSILANPINEASKQRAVNMFKEYIKTLGTLVQDNAIRNIIIDIRVML